MSLKILYAISNRPGAAIQLSRFLKAIDDKEYIVKTAGYRNSNLYLDWTLDALIDILNPERISFENDNLEIYFEQVKHFDPDLIISDLEVFTSYIGNVLDKTVWQVSPLLLYSGVKNKHRFGIYKNYSYIFDKQFTTNEFVKNILINSNCNFVYSHFGDTENPPKLIDNYEWIRPYHVKGHISRPCEHNVVAPLITNDKKIISILKNYRDVVIFSNFLDERYNDLILKDINNHQEYACNVKNCNFLINQGNTDFLADAFYNGKPCLIVPNFSDSESIINAAFSEQNGLSKTLYSNEKILIDIELNIHYDERIKLLDEKIGEL